MTAPNHALTGALIGLTVANPLLALPFAFISHLVQDAIPHYDADGEQAYQRILSKQFFRELILLGGSICVGIVAVLASTHPRHWLLAAICAFTATLPDVLWLPRYIHIKRIGNDVDMAAANIFWRFHDGIQWKTGRRYLWVEALWFVVFGTLLISKL